MSFKCKKYLEQHLKCKRHTDRINEKSFSENRRYECNVCGKKYSIRQSLHAHTKLKSCVVFTAATTPIIETPVEEMMKEKSDNYEKDRIDQNAILETMQQKFDVQKNEIEAMQQKIDKIAILLHNSNKHDSTCVIAEPQHQKSRDKRKKSVKL